MLDWQPIETALDTLPFAILGGRMSCPRFKSYAPALVYGPTWRPNGFGGDWPKDGRGSWTGEPRFAVASTYEGKGFWTIEADAPGDYDVHILPTHYVRLEPPGS